MTEYNATTILTDLEQAIRQDAPYHPEPMTADRYLLASALQKTIRRGNVKQATRIAASLIYTDRQRFWRRLAVIAAEDIGIGDIDTIATVFTAISSPAWLRQVGEVEAGVHLVRLLCMATKSRLADAVFIIAERAADYRILRERLAKAKDGTIINHITDEGKPLAERCLALWYAFGTRKFPSDAMPGRIGSPDKAANILRRLNAPAALVESSIAAMWRTQWPLTVFLPLIYQEAQKNPLKIVHDAIPAMPEVCGISIGALDVFTRGGQASIRQLQKLVPELHRFSIKQAGTALFYIDGGRVDRRLTSDTLETFQQRGEITDAESTGLSPSEYMELRECLAANMQRLNDIRRTELVRHLTSTPTTCKGEQK